MWHKRDRQAGRIPKGLHGVDQESTWGYSQHDGWVQGYSFEVVVSATAGSTVFPLLASADTASAKETANLPGENGDLPEKTCTTFWPTAATTATTLAEQVEYDEEDRRTGRRFLCPENRRGSKRRRGAAAPRAA